MNLLCKLLDCNNVLLGVAASSKKRIFEQASQTLSLLYGLDRKQIFDALFARERIGPTYIGHGFALPHCRLKELTEPKALFIRLHGEIDLGNSGEFLTHSLLFLLAPENAPEEHLNYLAAAAECFSDKHLREALNEASTPEQFCKILTPWCETQKDAVTEHQEKPT